MEDEAWKSMFTVVSKVEGGFLLIKKGEYFSYNMVLYKTRGGAERGARAAYNKINKEFENFLLK